MRRFTPTDKELISYLAQLESREFTLMDLCEGIGLVVNIRTRGEQDSMRILLENSPEGRAKINASKLIEVILSMRFLAENGLIVYLEEETFAYHREYKSYSGERHLTQRDEFFWLMNRSPYMDLEKLVREHYYATEELCVLHANKFLSTEEKALSAARWANRIAIGAAAIALYSLLTKC